MRLFFYCSIIASSRSVTLGKVAGQALGIGVVFNRCSILHGRHTGGLLEAFGKILERTKRKVVCNFCKIHGSVADQLLCSVDFHFQKMVNCTMMKFSVKQVVQRGGA